MSTHKKNIEKPRVFDVVVSGGGLIGLTLGEALAVHGLKVAVVDVSNPTTKISDGFDGRCTAIAYASKQMMDAIGLWQHLETVASPITDIRVSDAGSFFFIHFNQTDAGHSPMGFMIENRHLYSALYRRCQELKNLSLFTPHKVISFSPKNETGEVRLTKDLILQAQIVVSAEGRNSALRDAAGISVLKWNYNQTAIVATFRHELSHHGIAHEKFFSDGPFALLPLKNKTCSLVWSARSDYASVIMNLSKEDFEAELYNRIGNFLGKIDVLPSRWSYPLSYQRSEKISGERLALVGDAAHAIHPIAGQGLNMGLRDVAALTEILSAAKFLGEDLGSAQVLERYARWRRTDNLVLGVVTDGLTRVFSNKNPLLRILRSSGLGLANRITPLRKFFVQHARGTFGHLPKLLQDYPPKN